MYIGISLSSGSSRGVYQLGALHAAECHSLLSHVKFFAGTSIGSITSLLLAVGWTPVTLFSKLCTDDINNAFDFSFNVSQSLQHWGLYDTSKFKQYVEKLIIEKYGRVPTFQELYDETGNTFICTSYKLKSNKPCIYFNRLTHPMMSTLDAVILSCSIPLLFFAQSYEGSHYIDGGVFDINPVRYLEQYIKQHHNLTEFKVLGVTLAARLHVQEKDEGCIHTFLDFAKEIMLVSLFNQPRLESTKHSDCINIETGQSADTTALNVDNKTKVRWFCNGLEQGLNYFKSVLVDAATKEEFAEVADDTVNRK